ncbi:hypothetical protein [Bacillus chungangensis]|uniref:DNA-binding protein YlxM (UPF0122 family) n=1 Tax=Bacillus chungangensis TaxID=587633 RepID=A0ABT9WN75_9BACI|nr:hypothetical protein [Bacillus chungangensis]MDQ0174407.1 putative DNA-binding protein YlxM (UPF0122 family) [Bacillus chungangensis]
MKYYVADESLGGVEREYNAVERDANIGELVVLTKYEHVGYGEYAKVGDILTCTKTSCHDGSIRVKKNIDDVGYTFINKEYEDYAVLEPTGNVRIDGIIYRLVKRKADIGDRILVTDGSYPHLYTKGYYVLEIPAKSNTTSPRDVHDVIANLTDRVAKLERKLQTIEDEKADLAFKVAQVDTKITLDFENVAKLMVEKLGEALVCGTK